MKTGVYTSFVGIKKDMSTMVNEALESTTEEMLEKLKEFIKEDVYGAYDPFWYDRTNDILDAFRVTKSGSIGGIGIKGQAKIEFDKSKIYYYEGINNDFTHGNPWRSLGAENFLKLLNGDIKQGDAFNFPQIDREPFWNDFMNWADKNFKKIYNKNLSRLMLKSGMKIKAGK